MLLGCTQVTNFLHPASQYLEDEKKERVAKINYNDSKDFSDDCRMRRLEVEQ